MSDITKTATVPMVPTVVLPTGTIVLDLDTSRTVKVAGKDVRVKGWATLRNAGNAALEILSDDDDDDATDLGDTVDGTRTAHSINVAVSVGTAVPSSLSVAAFGAVKSAEMHAFTNRARVSKAGKVTAATPTYRGEATFARSNGARYVLSIAIRANKAGNAWRVAASLAQ